ncbi:MAG: hypothetical protein ACWA5R_10175 [bacterium]
MAGLKVRCVSINPYLDEKTDGIFVEGVYEGEMISLTLNNVYDVVEQDDEYYRIVDDTDEDYLYPKSMFEVI